MRTTLLTLVLTLALPVLADASQIAVGLDWRHNVFVQEFWQESKARYAIYNNRPEAIKLSATDVQFVAKPGTESFRAVEGQELARWEAKPKSVVIVDAPLAPGPGGLRFLRLRIVEGPQLGVLSFPIAPADLPQGKIVSCDGINGSGGRRQTVCYEQDVLHFPAGGIIEVKLTLPAGGETVTFKKAKSLDTPTEALISTAECATLPIHADREKIVIATTKPLKAAPVHVVTLRFNAPKVEAPTMVVIDGWVALSPSFPGGAGGGFHVVRGVLIQPEK